MKLILTVFCAVFFTAVGFAQTGSLSGTVLNSNGEAAEFAEIRVCKIADSSVVVGGTSEIDGSFTIAAIAKGTYLIKITLADHLSFYISSISIRSNETTALGSINMQKDETLNLDEVVVAGSLDDLKAGIDKKIYNVGQDISVRGGSVVDILNNIPSIDVDQEGKVSLRGDGNVTILIDGRPSALTARDGQSLLDALPANSIERIEVVTNPSAKYDPDGTSGIINIIMKKNRQKGLNGIVSGTAATGDSYDATLGLSYQNKATNVYLNYSYNFYEGYRNNFSDLTQLFGTDSSNYFDQDRIGSDSKLSNTLILGADFDLDSNNRLGFSMTGSLGTREREGDLFNYLYDQNDVLFRRWSRRSFDPVQSKNADFNINHTYKFKSGNGKWSSNATQSLGDQNILGFYDERIYSLDGTSFVPGVEQQLSNTSFQRITTLQTDVETIFEKIHARMETGVKAIIANDEIHTSSERYDTALNQYVPDTLADFDYIYDEQIYSVYGTFGQQLGKFSYQGGLRGEFAKQIPNLTSTGEKYDNTYLNLFPSAHTKYKPNKSTEFSLSYSRRINRAKSDQLNPFTSYADPFNLRRGNPALQPEYINSYDFSYSQIAKKVTFTASAYYRVTSDVINRVKEFTEDNATTITYANIDKSQSTGLETILLLRPYSWVKLTGSFNGSYINYVNSDTTVNWNNSGFNWGTKFALTFEFWKKTATLQFNGSYNAPRPTPQGIVFQRSALDVSFEKQLLNRRLSLGARVTDVFDTKGFEMDFDRDGITQHSEFKWLTRRFYISVSYRFGKQDAKLGNRPTRGDGGGGDD